MKKTIGMRVGDVEIIVARRDVGHSQFSTTSLMAAACKRAIGKQWHSNSAPVNKTADAPMSVKSCVA